MSYTTEVLRRVYDDGSGNYIEVRPDPDCPDLVRIHTSAPGSIEMYGLFEIVITPEMALKLAQAIAASAEEILNA